MGLTIGTHLGPYEILGPVGAGGMGEVYRALDPRLGREVAIKVLPEELASDPERLRRFRLEGRAASALNHPNLLTVFDADVDGAVAYLVTELLDGETLQARLAAGPLTVRKSVAIASEIARGLAGAHEGGIVHRDVKPENVFLTRDDRVKLLDFGLARPSSSTARTGSAAPTQAGLVVGTPGYMSPEQVAGEEIDGRSDIFGLGCVLYEMLTGQKPFERLTPVESMTATLREEPPPPVRPDGSLLDPALLAILVRCLEKRPARRFQSASDLAFQLETLEASEATQVLAAPARARRADRGSTWASRAGAVLAYAVVAVVAVAAGALGYRLASPHRADEPRMSFLTFSGHDTEPDASPDGSLVVFTSMREGVPRVWVKQLATSTETALTSGPDRYPRLSPDGASVLFTRGVPAAELAGSSRASALYRVPVLGGEARKVVDGAGAGDFSPDGRHVVFTRTREEKDRALEWTLVVASIEGGDEKTLGAASSRPLVSPRWSPDGSTIAVVRSGRLMSVPDEMLLVSVAGGAVRTLPAASPGVLSAPTWVQGSRRLVYAQSVTVTAYVPQSRLVEQDVLRGGSPRTLAWIPNQVTTVDAIDAIRGHGGVVLARGVVVDGLSLRQGLRELPLDGSPGRWLTRGGAVDRQPVFSPDGEWVVFSSSRSGNLDLWGLSPRDGTVRRITEDPADDWDPAFTPDGESLLWSSNRGDPARSGGRFEVYLADADGRRPRQVSRTATDAQNPSADRSGRVVWVSGDLRHMGLWRARLDGSEAALIVPGVHTMTPEVSPDGRFVLYHTPPDPGWCELRAVRVTDGLPAGFTIRFEVPAIPVAFSTRPRTIGRARFTPDGKAVVFVGLSGSGLPRLFVQDFDPGRDTTASRRPLVDTSDDLAIESFAISPDGRRLVASVVEQSPALMTVEGLSLPR